MVARGAALAEVGLVHPASRIPLVTLRADPEEARLVQEALSLSVEVSSVSVR